MIYYIKEIDTMNAKGRPNRKEIRISDVHFNEQKNRKRSESDCVDLQ